MLQRIVVCALLAGLLAGGASALLQQWLVIPVLLEAELYESGEAVHFGALAEPGTGDDQAGDAHGEEPAHAGEAEAEGAAHDHGTELGRLVRTIIATLGTNIGFAFILVGTIFATGATPAWREGVIWGICGFIAQMLAPALGHPPELPGVAAADLTARQIWWVGTVVATAVGIWLIAFQRGVWVLPAAILLIAAPHLVGAPHAQDYAGTAPPELAAIWAGRSLGVGLLSWAILGGAAAAIWHRLGGSEA